MWLGRPSSEQQSRTITVYGFSFFFSSRFVHANGGSPRTIVWSRQKGGEAVRSRVRTLRQDADGFSVVPFFLNGKKNKGPGGLSPSPATAEWYLRNEKEEDWD